MISRSAAYSSSMRPEEVREMRKKSLDAEKQNLQSLLTEIQNTRTSLTANLTRSDALVEKLRTKLEADIDNAFKDDEPDK
jgi:flagellar biosynthesis chaperone FliJ